MVIRSIRWRLQLWLGFLLAAVLLGFGLTVHQLQGLSQRNQLDEDLGRRVALLSIAVRGGSGGGRGGGGPGSGMRPPGMSFDEPRMPPPEPRGGRDGPGGPGGPGGGRGGGGGPEPRLSGASFEAALAAGPPGGHLAAWSRSGALMGRTEEGGPEILRPERPGRNTQIQYRTRDGLRECYQFTELGDCVLAGRPLGPLERAQTRLAWILLAVGLLVLAAGLGGGWWLTTQALRPVEEIRTAAERISGGVLSERIGTTEPGSEIGRLAAVLNAMFDRLEAAFNRQRRFIDDAAHELRTPLAVLLVEAQSALARERSKEEYRETIAASLATAQQMRRLTDSMLQLARLDTGETVSRPELVDLAVLTRLRCDVLQPLASQKGIDLQVGTMPAPVAGDADRLGQVVTNLVANAIQYTPNGGVVRVRTGRDGDSCVLVVGDTGVGIASEDQPRVFDRFYRVDKSRSRSEGHSGLGLAITKAVVEAHQGRITVESVPGAGSTFTVRLPAASERPAGPGAAIG